MCAWAGERVGSLSIQLLGERREGRLEVVTFLVLIWSSEVNAETGGATRIDLPNSIAAI